MSIKKNPKSSYQPFTKAESHPLEWDNTFQSKAKAKAGR